VKKLSTMINDFFIKWLLFPASIFIIIFSFFWACIEVKEIKKLQLYYTEDIGRHVKTYLDNCKNNLTHVELHLDPNNSAETKIKKVTGAELSFDAVCLLDENMTTIRSVPYKSFKGDFSGFINKKNKNSSFFLTSPYYSILKNKTSVAMVKKTEKSKGFILAELNLSQLDDYIKKLTSSIKNGRIFLTDSYGNIISHSNRFLVNSRTNFGDKLIIKKLKNNETFSGFLIDDGKCHLISAGKIPSADWIIVMEQEAFSILCPLLIYGISLLIFVLTLFYIFIFLFNRKIYKSAVLPITGFAKKIDSIKNLGTTNFISSKKETFEELGTLEKSFLKMRDTILEREKELRESREKYMGIVEDSPSLICSFLADGTIVFVNKEYCRYFKKSPKEIIGTNFLKLLPEKTGKFILKSLSLLTPEAPIQTNEHMVIGRNKKLRWHKWTYRAIFDNLGNVSVFQGTGEDITKKKIDEEKLAAERERLSITLKSIGDGVITTDTDGKIILVNKVAEQLTGWKQEEAKNKKLTEVFNIINEETGLPCENPVEKVLLTGEMVELENHTTLISKTGEKRAIADSGAPIKDRKNKTIGVVLVFRDTTEKKKLQEALVKTAKLDSLGVLAGGVAHDFNNLLAGIFGYIELALIFSNDPKVNKFLNKAVGAMDRAKSLTGQLLTFSKGGFPIKEPGLLFPFIKKTTKFALSGSNIKCHFKFPEKNVFCNFDKNQMAQVIDNLVINAKQAMPSGGELDIESENIFIKNHPILNPGNYIKISIKDTGGGIPLKIKPKIFDPFFTTKETGHGIGLSTSYSIIEKHGGTIEVESEPGKGSVFKVYLPSFETKTREQKSFEIKENHSGSGIILIIDDEKLVLEMISSMVKTLGYDSELKESPKEAIKFFKEKINSKTKISAVICDLTIPGEMGGRGIVAEIRKFDKKTPVFVASGYSENPVMINPKKYGFTSSISKPFKRSELAKLLNTYLDKN